MCTPPTFRSPRSPAFPNRCCTQCGKILDDNVFSTDPTFSKTAGGATQVDGNFVPESGVTANVGRGTRGGRIFGLQVDSHEKTINKGKYEISQVADRLGIRPREDIANAAHRLYKLAVQRNFTRGRRTQQVAAACLYIICRQESRPYMLIDFSDVVQTNVYVLGAVFLQLCRLLRLEQHPLISKPIDPSLFIHRFADRLTLGRKMHAVANTALRLVASMKRDWMQTGRRPSGVCGAALWVAALLHGYERSKRDVVAVVHVGEATLRKRVTEFENTPSAMLSVEEFDVRAKDYEKEQAALAESGVPLLLGSQGAMTCLTCVHKDHDGATHFAHGMCRQCYLEYARVSGGARGGEDPPAFQAAEAKRDRDAQLALPAPERAGALPAPTPTLALPAPAAKGTNKKGKKMSAKEAREAMEAIEREVRAKAKADAATRAKTSAPKVSDKFLEDEMERALDEQNTHLGEFAVMTGLRNKKDSKVKRERLMSPEAEVPGKSVAPEVADAAVQLLKTLIGDARATKVCLPLARDGRAKGASNGKHLSSAHPDAKTDKKGIGSGGRIAAADETQLHFLVANGCFDSSAVARIKKFTKHDVEYMLATPLPIKRHVTMGAPPVSVPGRVAATIAPPKVDKKKVKSILKVKDEEDPETDTDAEPDTFSDVDDEEIDNYIHTAEEVKLRRVIWSELNRDYLETQAAKEAAVAAAPPALPGTGGEPGKGGKKRKKYTHQVPADTAAEAAQQMLSSKKISSKINYDALNDLFKQDEQQNERAKKGKTKGSGRTDANIDTSAGQAAPVQGPGKGRLSRLAGGSGGLGGLGGSKGLGGGGLGSRLAAGATLASGGETNAQAETAAAAVGSKFDSIAAAVDIRPKQTARKSRGLSAATLAMAGKRKGGKKGSEATN